MVSYKYVCLYVHVISSYILYISVFAIDIDPKLKHVTLRHDYIGEYNIGMIYHIAGMEFNLAVWRITEKPPN